jgi:hypothetical protein
VADVERHQLNEYVDLPGRVSDETLFSVLQRRTCA